MHTVNILCNISLSINQFLCCDHSLESSHRDDSNEWSQHRNWLILKEILHKMLTISIAICSFELGYDVTLLDCLLASLAL